MSTRTGFSVGLWDALQRAQRAPSVHNTQPWRWRLTDVGVELYADRTRHLVDTDPDQRDLIISCGAALHHLRVALAAAGLAAEVNRLPNPENRDHLATIHLRPGSPEPADASLARAIELRRTDRRRFSAQPVSAGVLADLTADAAANGTLLHPVTDDASRRQLIAVLVEAATQQRHIPGYSAELTIWTRRYSDAHDGVPAESRPAAGAQPLGVGLRPFPPGRLTSPTYPSEPDQDGSTLLVLTTTGDSMVDQLRAGEATSAVLLAATRHRLATTPLSHALEVAHTRRQLASRVLRTPDVAQLVIRVGWATSGLEPAPTPRRPLESVLLRR